MMPCDRSGETANATIVGALPRRRRSPAHPTSSQRLRHLLAGLPSFPLPVATPEITVSRWHARLAADPAHRCRRGCVRDVCTLQIKRSSDP